jgi:hypothetical protein
MGLILKNPLAGETGVRGFSKLVEGFFLMKTVGQSYPPARPWSLLLSSSRIDRTGHLRILFHEKIGVL